MTHTEFKEHTKRLKWKYQDAADNLGVSVGMVKHYATGRKTIPDSVAQQLITLEKAGPEVVEQEMPKPKPSEKDQEQADVALLAKAEEIIRLDQMDRHGSHTPTDEMDPESLAYKVRLDNLKSIALDLAKGVSYENKKLFPFHKRTVTSGGKCRGSTDQKIDYSSDQTPKTERTWS